MLKPKYLGRPIRGMVDAVKCVSSSHRREKVSSMGLVPTQGRKEAAVAEAADNDKIRLVNEHETYLSTLYGKALDSRAADPILGDTYADEAVRRIDFDFEKLKLASGGVVTLPVRAKHLDSWAREFLAVHPTATVLHLGCGLDTRVFRINPPPAVRWYDVDLPEVIELRRRLYPERHDYTLIAASVTDLPWLDQIPAERPVLVVAEGLVEYLPKDGAAALFNRITEQFPSGEIIFDAYSRLTVRMINFAVRVSSIRAPATAAGTRVVLPWGIDDPHEVEQLAPRLRLVAAVPFLTMHELVTRLSQSRAQTALYRMLAQFGWYRRSMQHFRYAF
jgi:O-methyltransferase involved in polyketide biosynthesis